MLGDRPMTAAERQEARRKRLLAEAEAAAAKPEGAETEALLRGLSLTLATLADAGKAKSHRGARFAAERAIYELCQRFSLTPQPAPTGKK
jgi:hypothetical protein